MTKKRDCSETLNSACLLHVRHACISLIVWRELIVSKQLASLFFDTELPICFFFPAVTFTDCTDRRHFVFTSSNNRVKVEHDGTLTVSQVFLLFNKCFPISFFRYPRTCTISCRLNKVRTMHACRCRHRLRERLLSTTDG